MENSFEIKSKGTTIGKAAEFDTIYSSAIFRFLFFCIWIFGFVSLALIFGNYLKIMPLENRFLGICFVILSLFLFYLAERFFYIKKLKNPEFVSLGELAEKINSKNLPAGESEKFNLFQFFSFELAKATKNLFSDEKMPNAKDLAVSLLKSSDANFLFSRIGVSADEILKDLAKYENSSDILKIFLEALAVAKKLSHNQIEVCDVIYALCKLDPYFAKLINELKLDCNDIENVDYWLGKIEKKIKNQKKLSSKLRLTGGIGKDWAFGWTPFLKQFSVDLTENAGESQVEYIGHDNEIEQIKEALLKQAGGNAILVGEAGIGKRTTLMGFAQKVANGETNSHLDFCHIIKIDIDYLMAGTTNAGEISERLMGIFNEAANAGNIIIYIENFQNLLSSGETGKIDATEVLVPILDNPNIHIIATADVSSYNQFIAPSSALSQKFERVTVDEPSKDELIKILEDIAPTVEYHSQSFLSYEVIKETVSAADKYILTLPDPEKSINLLDAVASKANSERGKTIISAKDVLSYVSEKYKIPLGEVGEDEKQKLLLLENELHQSVIGQNEAINAISNAMRRSRAGVTDSKKPIGSFLFLGPTGVGKTETAKALAKSYFGNVDKMIRFDMSEYKNKEDVYRLIGSSIGEEKLGILSVAVREHPFSLILFDEIEKACPDILDLFLQILDEGFVTDGLGRKVLFRNTIIICTSNAGANLIREAIQSGGQYDTTKTKLLNYLQNEGIFRPEFINRFTSVIAFSPLSENEAAEVAGLMLKSLQKTVAENKGIGLSVTADAVAALAKIGFDPQMGARPMARIIQEKIEDLLAKKILSGELKKGDTITISAQDVG